MSSSIAESITIDDVEKYLADVRELIQNKNIQLSKRDKNKLFQHKSEMRRADIFKLVSNLTYFDFCKTLKNDTKNPKYADEILYLFTKTIEIESWGQSNEYDLYIKLNLTECEDGRRVIVVSFHECEFDLKRKFK